MVKMSINRILLGFLVWSVCPSDLFHEACIVRIRQWGSQSDAPDAVIVVHVHGVVFCFVLFFLREGAI